MKLRAVGLAGFLVYSSLLCMDEGLLRGSGLTLTQAQTEKGLQCQVSDSPARGKEWRKQANEMSILPQHKRDPNKEAELYLAAAQAFAEAAQTVDPLYLMTAVFCLQRVPKNCNVWIYGEKCKHIEDQLERLRKQMLLKHNAFRVTWDPKKRLAATWKKS